MRKQEAPIEKQLERLTRLLLTSRDFQLALSAVTFLLEEVDWNERYPIADLRRFYCYESAFVVSYIRPFAESRGGIRPFSWKDISLKLTEDEKYLHDLLLLNRNKAVAHSDADYVELRRIIYRTQLDADRDPFDFAFPRYHEGVTLTYDQCRTAEALLFRATDRTLDAIQNLKDLDGAEFRVIDV